MNADDDFFDTGDEAPAAPGSPEFGPAIAALLRHPITTVEHDPDTVRLAVHYREEIADWCRRTLDWQFDVNPLEGVCRLYKRRRDPPADRPPRLIRTQRAARRPAPTLVLVLVCLVCEQLWRHPETGFNDLQRAIGQSCAAEAETGRLPKYQPVAPDGRNLAKAETDRTALVDALRLLENWGMITVDRSLDVAEQDPNADLVITARRERLSLLPACPSPTMLDIDLDRPHEHVDLLCSDQAGLPEHASANQHDLRRRHVAMRFVLDDPGVAPDSDTEAGGYLTTAAGRRNALAAAATAGLVCTVRRDWWIVADPHGATTPVEFPTGRAQEHQAAAVLLAELAARTDPRAGITADAAAALLQKHLDMRPWWAGRYRTANGARRLADQAIEQLIDAGIVYPSHTQPWTPTPAIHTWQVRLSEPADRPDRQAPGPDSDPGEQ
jgi:uncharacterized protein (TIGR02678 family)